MYEIWIPHRFSKVQQVFVDGVERARLTKVKRGLWTVSVPNVHWYEKTKPVKAGPNTGHPVGVFETKTAALTAIIDIVKSGEFDSQPLILEE